MKEIVESLAKKGVLFRTLEPIALKTLGSRKKLSLYLGVDMAGYYAIVMVLKKKSRILSKEAGELIALHEKLEERKGTKIRRKYLLLDAAICSKAKIMLENKGWEVREI